MNGLSLLNYRSIPNENLKLLTEMNEIPILFKQFINLFELDYDLSNLDKVMLGKEKEIIGSVPMFQNFKQKK